ncbi:MAG: KpsF/GutQ family sugar-phosphate isomerase [Alphaproteobacteria bacterium]
MIEHSDDTIITAGREVLDEGAACLGTASGRLGADFAAAARALAEPDSFTTVIGVGKSGYIGRKLAASLLSTGHGAAFLHPTDALHGDLGIADHSTLAILLSNSGNTEELVTLIPMIRQFGVKSVLISQGRDCALASDVDWIIETTVTEEAGIGRLAPTSSSTTTLALCDALMMASLAIRNFTAEDFQRYHPGGMLGQKMRRVGDEMLPLDRLTWVAPNTGIHQVIEQMSTDGQGFAIVSEQPKGPGVSPGDVGFISDGDIRRAAQDRDGFAAMTAASIMSPSPQAVSANAFAIEALRLMEQRAITSLLCTDERGAIIGAVHIHGIVARELGLEPARGQAPD